MFAGKKSAQIREILISESAWEDMTCLFAPSLDKSQKTQLINLHADAQECMNNIDASQFNPQAFLKMVKTGNVDEKVFKQQIAIQNGLHEQAAHCRITYYTNVSKMLTQEQKKKLVEMYKQQAAG